eukprot:2654180-Prymnesium_polylepis.1
MAPPEALGGRAKGSAGTTQRRLCRLLRSIPDGAPRTRRAASRAPAARRQSRPRARSGARGTSARRAAGWRTAPPPGPWAAGPACTARASAARSSCRATLAARPRCSPSPCRWHRRWSARTTP